MRHLLAPIALATLVSCGPPSQADLDGTRGSRVEVMFNDPGSRLDQIWRQPDAVKLMIDLINEAQVTIDFAVMGFSYEPLVDALIAAHDRGVKVRMVGDAGHLYNSGYRRFYERHIPIVTGNGPHIMHDKFMIVDDRFVVGGTANWTPTDLEHNSNNFYMMDHPDVAADFKDEHEQMFQGAFGHTKVEIDNGRRYQVGDTEVEVWFSPNEDSLGRILELVDGAQESVRFTIFAFTKDQVGSAFIRKHEELVKKGIVEDGDYTTGVTGVIDQSQLHSNGQYHEVYRLLGTGMPLRLDGNDASRQPGDYQAGGGRLHSKTMVIDPDGENPVVISGSFNWSSSATQSNDEFMVVFHGGRVAQEYAEYYRLLWDNAKQFGEERIGENDLEEGDVVINEVHWYGAHEKDLDGNDEFIELRNMTDRVLDLDMWQIVNEDDFVVGLPPGTVIQPGGVYSIVDHVLEPYEDGAPQDESSAFTWGDLVVNAFNDNRMSRLYIKDQALELILKDPDGEIMDRAGDGGPAFAGGPTSGGKFRSMQRIDPNVDGADRDNWESTPGDEGGIHVSEEPLNGAQRFKDVIIATPGEPSR